MADITREQVIAYIQQSGGREIVEQQTIQYRRWAFEYTCNVLYAKREERPTPSDAFVNILEHEVRPFVDTFLNVKGGSPVVGTHLTTIDTFAALAIGGIGIGALECAVTTSKEQNNKRTTISRRSFLKLAGTYGAAISLTGGALKFTEIITRNSSYDSLFNKILMSQYPEELFIPVLAHEYTHFLQRQTKLFESRTGVLKVLREGHATGVAFAYARERSTTHPELAGAFSEFIGGQTIRVLRSWDDLQSLDTHSLGHALFIVAEAKHGPGIYAEALREPRVVLA